MISYYQNYKLKFNAYAFKNYIQNVDYSSMVVSVISVV